MSNITPIFDPLADGKSKLQLLGVLGSDKDVVEDARTSFATERSYDFIAKDENLLNYLIKNKHTSPLRGSVLKFNVKAPLFVARQWWKHVIASAYCETQVGWNEQSMRYVEASDSSDYYVPQVFRKQAKNNRQATEGAIEENGKAKGTYLMAIEDSYEAYQELLAMGVGREQARGVLSPAFYTTFVWTASLQSVLNFISLRLGHGAQAEIGAYAAIIAEIVAEKFPCTYAAFEANGYEI